VYVLLAIDCRRQLRALPALDAEMLISCGMFSQLLCAALRAQGIESDVTWLDKRNRYADTASIEETEQIRALALIALRRSGQGKKLELDRLKRIAMSRRTQRQQYLGRPCTVEEVARLIAPTDAELDLNIAIESDRRKREAVAALVRRFAVRDFSCYSAWRETFRYIHFNENKSADDGFFLRSLMGPMSQARQRLMRWVLDPAVMQCLRLFGTPCRMASQLADLVAGSPHLLVAALPCARSQEQELFQAGSRLLEVWLRAEELGLAIHPISVMLQHEDARQALQASLSTPGRVIFFARLGRGSGGCGTNPRRSADSIVDFTRSAWAAG